MMKKMAILVLTVVLLSSIFAFTVQAYEFEDGPQFDFNGERVVIVKDRGMLMPEEGTEYYARFEAVEDFFNVEIEIIEVGAYNTDGALERLMSGDPVDLLRFEHPDMINLYAQEVLKPLNDLVTEEYIDELDVPEFVKHEYRVGNEILRYQGNIYATTSFDREGMRLQGHGMTFLWNQDLLEREGLPSLYEILEEEKLTWEKLKELGREVTKDTDGDGEIDQFGFGRRLTYRNGMNLYATNNAALTRASDNKIILAANEPEAIETANFITSLVDEGLTTYEKEDAEADRDEFADGNIAFHFEQGAEYVRGIEWWFTEDLMEDDWGVAPWPLGPEAEEYKGSPVQTLPPVVSVPVTARYDTEKLLTLYRALHPRDPDVIDDFREQYEQLVRDKETYEAIEKYYLGFRGDPQEVATVARHWKFLPDFDFEAATSGEIDYVRHIEELAPEIQAYLDDVFNF